MAMTAAAVNTTFVFIKNHAYKNVEAYQITWKDKEIVILLVAISFLASDEI